MRPVGFSTGALAHGDFRAALSMLVRGPTAAIELSALREPEFEPLISALPHLDLSQFCYVSLHVPSRLETLSDARVVESLGLAIERRWPIVLHPDAIADFRPWLRLGSLVCIENMDGRKTTGRTVDELAKVFDALPEASLCFDIAHARQVD